MLNCLGTPAVSLAGRPLAQDPAPPWEVAPRPHPAHLPHQARGQQATELYRAYPGANCRVGQLDDDDDDPYSPVRVTVAECKARCEADAECTCVTHRRSDGACWKRAGCSAAAFEYAPNNNSAPPSGGNSSSEGDVYDVYVSVARHLREWSTNLRARAQSGLATRGVDEPLCSSVQPRVSYPS